MEFEDKQSQSVSEAELTRLRNIKEGYPLFHREIVWRNVFIITGLHLLGLYGLTLLPKCLWRSLVFTFAASIISSTGVTAGAHRLWTHRSYKAKLPMKIILLLLNSMAYVSPIVDWVRDHRTHHKYSDTVADPHNATHGFFYSHVAWLFVRKHPEVIKKGKGIDMSDIYADQVVMFQKRHYLKIVLFMWAVEAVVPLTWGETFFNSFFLCFVRFCYVINGIWLVNSAAHLWGMRDYDKNIMPGNNIWVVLYGFSAEGFHNYHHVFPYDYQLNEMPYCINFSTYFIQTMALLGQAWDLRKASPKTVLARTQRTGKMS